MKKVCPFELDKLLLIFESPVDCVDKKEVKRNRKTNRHIKRQKKAKWLTWIYGE